MPAGQHEHRGKGKETREGEDETLWDIWNIAGAVSLLSLGPQNSLIAHFLKISAHFLDGSPKICAVQICKLRWQFKPGSELKNSRPWPNADRFRRNLS
jgi:hypothetical protein